MADNQTIPNITLPQRSITITGPLTARLFQVAIRASRIDLRAMQVAFAPPRVRDPSNRAIERYAEAISRFETELALVESDLDNAGRSGPSRTNGPKNDGKQSGPKAVPSKKSGNDAGAVTPGSKATNGASGASGAEGQGNAPAQPKKKRTRTRNKSNGAGDTAQASQPQQSAPTQQPPHKEALSAAAPAAPVAAQVAAPVQPQAAKTADVPANIQAL